MPRQVASIVRGSAQQGLELCEDLLDRVEVGRVAGTKNSLAPGAADQAAHRRALVAAEIVADDNVAALKGAAGIARPKREGWCH